MSKNDPKPDWKNLSEEALSGVKEWREAHPKATFAEIERAVDERLTRLRARMLQDLAQESEAGDWSKASEEASPLCPNCGGPQAHAWQAKSRAAKQRGKRHPCRTPICQL